MRRKEVKLRRMGERNYSGPADKTEELDTTNVKGKTCDTGEREGGEEEEEGRRTFHWTSLILSWLTLTAQLSATSNSADPAGSITLFSRSVYHTPALSALFADTDF